MPNRKRLDSTLWLAFALALLASVLVGPIRTSGFVIGSTRYEHLCRNFALPSDQQAKAHRGTSMATGSVLQVKALPFEYETRDRADALDEPSENEEQGRADALDEPCVSFMRPCSFRKEPDRHLIAPPSILSLRPLRC